MPTTHTGPVGGFDLPGGRVDEGEDIFAGAVRETMEEANLQLDRHKLQLVFATTKSGHHTEEKTDINIVWLGFIAKLPSGQTPRLSHEHQEFAWRTVGQAIADFNNAPTQRSFLIHLHENRLAETLASR